jgi:hypothetical protein
LLEIIPQARSSVSAQLKEIFNWLSDRDQDKYRSDEFMKLLEIYAEKTCSYYDMSAQRVLEMMIGERQLSWSSKAAQFWTGRYTELMNTCSVVHENHHADVIHVSEMDQTENPTLILGGDVPPKEMKAPYLMRCSPEDSLNMEGAGFLFGKTLNSKSYLHPVQIASAVLKLRKK